LTENINGEDDKGVPVPEIEKPQPTPLIDGSVEEGSSMAEQLFVYSLNAFNAGRRS
jgi:hypothetical protein